MVLTLSDKTGEVRNHSNTSENVEKVETYKIVENNADRDVEDEEKDHSLVELTAGCPDILHNRRLFKPVSTDTRVSQACFQF